MKTFTVVYVGQARYLECIEYHKSIIAGSSKIFASLSPDLVELWRLPSEVTHSIKGNLTEKEILDKLNLMSIFDDIKILNHADYAGFDYNGVDFYPCAYMYSLYKSLDNIDTDFVVFLTTDLIFEKISPSIAEYIDPILIEDIPKAYVQLIDSNMLKPFFVCINRKGINKLRKRFLNSLEIYLKSTSEYKLKNEYATHKILSICGLKIEQRPFKNNMHRFRPNMSLDNILNVNFNELENLRKEYSLNKADRNKRRNEIIKPLQ